MSAAKTPVSQATPLPASNVIQDKGDLDNAFNYMQHVNGAALNTESVNLRAVRRKIDWHIVLLLFICYTVSVLDKASINYAAVMGLNNDLKLVGNQFSNASTALFVAYLIAEVPNAYILQKIPAPKWLAMNIFLWGIATASMAATKNYRTLLVARIFIGIFEASLTPSLMLITSQYYTRPEQATRSMGWGFGTGVSQMLGGLISFAFQHVGPGHLSSWKIMFLVLGALTVCVSFLFVLMLPNTPMEAKFLTDTEKVALFEHVSVNRTGVENRHFKPSQTLELLFDVQIWLQALIIILITISSGVITSYSSTVIKQFGYTPKVTALLGIPSGLVALLFSATVGFGIRFYSHRWAWLVMCCIPGILGGSLMSFAPKTNKAALLTGVFLINAIIPTLFIMYLWVMSNVAGHTKRVVANAFIAASFSVGNIIGPQTFRAKDAPEYHTAKVIVLSTQTGAAVMTCVLAAYYWWANMRKDKKLRALERKGVVADGTLETWGNMTDKENLRFRYVY